MKKIHTHYDNLRISRNAPREVIRAAYKALSQKYHPDKSQRPDADEVMAILNRSYAVLSDERQRRKHDAWIAAQEGLTPGARQDQEKNPRNAEPLSRVHEAMARIAAAGTWRNWATHLTPIRIFIFLTGLIMLLLYLSFSGSEKHTPAQASQAASTPAHDRSVDDMERTLATIAEDAALDSRSLRARKGREKKEADSQGSRVAEAKKTWALDPDGFPWPLGPRVYREDAAYRNGLSTITIDNSRNAHAVHAKLGVESDGGEVAREFYIPEHRMITLEYLSAGAYYIKYRDLTTGHIFRSPDFRLEGTDRDGDARYSNFEMALHTVNNGNARFSNIPESEF